MTENNTNNSPKRPPRHWFPAIVNLFCPGLGQLVQGRYREFFCYFILYLMLVLTAAPIFYYRSHFGLWLFVFCGILLLLLVPLLLFSVLDAALWQPNAPPRFGRQFEPLAALIAAAFLCGILLVPRMLPAPKPQESMPENHVNEAVESTNSSHSPQLP